MRCSRYAFGPNRLHYCGPDAHREIFSYIQENAADPGLVALLKGFRTMYPYLRHIAAANGIRDVFDNRVVEAYWIGNELLEAVEKKEFWRHLIDDHGIKDRIGTKPFDLVTDKIRRGAVPHHSFHVLDIWKRTGHLEQEQTLESMDACRISWGKLTAIDGPNLTVETEPLLYLGGKLVLGPPAPKKMVKNLEADIDIDELRVGDIVSMHWGVVCEALTPGQASLLRKYTLRHIALANLTI